MVRLGKFSIAVDLWRLRLFSFGGYGLALAALALVVFGDNDTYPSKIVLYFERAHLPKTEWVIFSMAPIRLHRSIDFRKRLAAQY